METICVCSKCGETSARWENTDNWLIASRPGKPGQVVIRCPDCITRYAVRKAGGYIEDGRGRVGGWVYEMSQKCT